MISTFVHPIGKEQLVSDRYGNLMTAGNRNELVLRPVNGCYDFTVLSETRTTEKDHYAVHYDARQSPAEGVAFSEELLERLWHEKSSFKLLYDVVHGTVGDIRGKDILLLGNGTSLKEFSFALGGGDIVYTDLSIEAVQYAKSCYENSVFFSKADWKIQFHAVDALHLPFSDESFDVLYGCAFVHHIQKLDAFFAEVNRCLKKGGRCIFLDDAQSKWWNTAKKTVLRPLQIISHRRTGISPEDKLATERGGYGKGELRQILKMQKFSDLIYKRTMFFEHLIHRGMMKLLHESLGCALAPMGRFVDNRLLGPEFIKRNGMLLVWGAKK